MHGGVGHHLLSGSGGEAPWFSELGGLRCPAQNRTVGPKVRGENQAPLRLLGLPTVPLWTTATEASRVPRAWKDGHKTLQGLQAPS